MDIKSARESLGLSQRQFSAVVGVSTGTVSRWERGDTNPSPLAFSRINEILELSKEHGAIERLLDEAEEVLLAKGQSAKKTVAFEYGDKSFEATFTPYVANGPEDQQGFFEKLVSMQQCASPTLEWSTYKERLSLISEIDGVSTAQYRLEQPNAKAKSWTPNMGPHGWHRYVGRFPAQFIRAILNSFQLDSEDTVIDPFCGSGTTLVEARLLGIPSIGIEVSPLSALISSVKCQFPDNGTSLRELSEDFSRFYESKWASFLHQQTLENTDFESLLKRPGNSIPTFSNIEKWFTKEAFLGSSICVEYINQMEAGFERDALAVALSSKMRSIGNVDVDVVRAEYSKKPREQVNVNKLVSNQLLRMATSIDKTNSTHKEIIAPSSDAKVLIGDCRSIEIEPGSISAIVTSPPYGIESLSYLRTHLLSFRVLEPVLGVDPYNFNEGVIGSEYGGSQSDVENQILATSIPSKTFASFFDSLNPETPKDASRVLAMKQFFIDMYEVIALFEKWLKPGGKTAFVIGNKRIGEQMIPTESIITELFESRGLRCFDSINHKLKTNNSNSVVPWQDRIIDNEYALFFEKED